MGAVRHLHRRRAGIAVDRDHLDAQALGPVFTLGCTNGAHNYLPTAAAYELGGYETNHAHRYYHSLMYSAESERIVREALYDLLGVSEPDWTPYSA